MHVAKYIKRYFRTFIILTSLTFVLANTNIDINPLNNKQITLIQNVSYKNVLNDEVDEDIISGTLQSKNYPKPYTKDSSLEFSKTFEEGYTIDITIEALDLDSAHGDYLLIKSGISKDSTGNHVILLYSFKKPRYYRTIGSSVYIQFVVGPRSDSESIKNSGFLLNWERTGFIKTTTEPPSTTIMPEDLFEYLTVYLTGDITAESFAQDKVSLFTDLLVKMSNKYCNEEQIPIENEISANDIRIKRISHCSLTWPNYENCVKVIFAIPVRLINDTTKYNSTYELSEVHLNEMWNQYHKEMLPSIDVQDYKLPNFEINIIVWISICLVMTILFSILLYFLWQYDFFDLDTRKRRLSETNSIYGEEKPRASDISLTLSPHQVVPPLFDTPKQPLNEDNIDYELQNVNNSFFPLYEPEDLHYISNTNNNLMQNSPSNYTSEINCTGYNNTSFVDDDEHVLYRHPARSLNKNMVSFCEEVQDSAL